MLSTRPRNLANLDIDQENDVLSRYEYWQTVALTAETLPEEAELLNAFGMIVLDGMSVNPQTAGLITQTLAAFVGTLAFADLFGVPRAQYVTSGLIGAVGWLLYLVLVRFAAVSPIIAVILSSVLICVLARIAAIDHKCPAQVFLLCGIFPLVPGAGIFWCTYYLVSGQLAPALTSGFGAAKTAVAIVLGIIVAMELPQRLFSGRKRRVERPVH